ncbi:MAG: carbon-nitrogen hydrolase family protein [Pseudomonadales bacterium]|nr:carbon-nitrogen hydrolase family protein [Pseudomonadales bacterium]
MPTPELQAEITSVGLIQLCAGEDVGSNLATASHLISQAVSEGASVVLLPEAFAYIGRDAGKREILEPLPADSATPAPAPTPILDLCRGLAREHGIDLILGGHHESSADPARSFNTCVHIAPDGHLAARYRKIHLFDVNLADGTQLHESARTLPGDRAVTTRLPFGILGLTICYDVRFPYLYQRLVDQGAIALSVPSAFTATTGAAHWHTLLRARAIECQSYVLAPAQHGAHNPKRRSYGHSIIIDPWGETLAELVQGDGVVVAAIDPARVAQVRAELPSLTHRRTME